MASAAILSREEFRDRQRHAAIRQPWPNHWAQWRDRLEDHVTKPTPTWHELTEAVLALRQEWTHAVTEGLVEHAHRAALAQRTAVCPPWGPTLSARGPQERPVATLVGAIRLRRPYVYCERCQLGSTPLDAALELTERRKQPAVPKAAVQRTTEGPSETACARCTELPGLPLRVPTAHEGTQAVAAGVTGLDVAPSRAAVVAKMVTVAEGQPWRPILVLASAGAEVPTRPETAQGRRPGRKTGRATRGRWTGEWREANGCRCDLIADDRLVQVWSGHQVPTEAEAAEALRRGNAAGLMPEAAVRLCVMAAGARWSWTPAQALLPSAVASLDYDHGRERLHQVAAVP
jgi:hypothetical protein